MREIVCEACFTKHAGPEPGMMKRIVKLEVKKPVDHAITINGEKQPQLETIICDGCGRAMPDGTVGFAVTVNRPERTIGPWEQEFGKVLGPVGWSESTKQFMKTNNRLTKRELAALQWAVLEARVNEGALTGDPDPHPLRAFKRKVTLAESALNKLRPKKDRF